MAKHHINQVESRRCRTRVAPPGLTNATVTRLPSATVIDTSTRTSDRGQEPGGGGGDGVGDGDGDGGKVPGKGQMIMSELHELPSIARKELLRESEGLVITALPSGIAFLPLPRPAHHNITHKTPAKVV